MSVVFLMKSCAQLIYSYCIMLFLKLLKDIKYTVPEHYPRDTVLTWLSYDRRFSWYLELYADPYFIKSSTTCYLRTCLWNKWFSLPVRSFKTDQKRSKWGHKNFEQSYHWAHHHRSWCNSPLNSFTFTNPLLIEKCSICVCAFQESSREILWYN